MYDQQPPVVTPDPAGRRPLLKSGGVVAVAVMLLNLAGYALALVAARALDPSSFGELNALLGALLIASVPAVALQAVVAQAVARRPAAEPRGARETALLVRAAVAGALVAALAVAAAPLLAAFLHVGLAGPLWLAAGLAPLAVLSAAAGVLQGAERFSALALLIGSQAAARGAGILVLLLDAGPTGVLAALAASTAAAAALGLALVGPFRLGRAARSLPGMPSARSALMATWGLLAFLLLANLDLLLARHVLSRETSGDYSVGSVCAKVAIWLPQAVVVVVFPRLADPQVGRALLRRAVGVLLLIGSLEMLGALLLARPALELAFGAGYAGMAPLVPVFVLAGAGLSLVQLLLYSSIATADPLPGVLIFSAAVVEATLVLALRPSTPGPVAAVAAGVVVVLVAALLILARRGDPLHRTR